MRTFAVAVVLAGFSGCTGGTDDAGTDDGHLATLVVTGGPGMDHLESDATHLYWVLNGQETGERGQVGRVALAGGEPELVKAVDGRVYGMALDEDAVYFSARASGGGQLWRAAKDGSYAEMIASPFDDPGAVAVDDLHVYVATPGLENAIWRIAKADGQRSIVADGLDNPWDLAVDDTYLYVSEMNRSRILRYAKSDDEQRSLQASVLYQGPGGGTAFMALAGDTLYFSGCYGDGACQPATLSRVSRLGGPATVLATSMFGTDAGTRVAVGGAGVVWGSLFVPLAGNPVRLAGDTAEDGVHYAAPAIVGDQAFLGDFYTGRVMRVSIPEQ